MAYDEQLAARIRDLVADETGLTEQKMFGGLAFLVEGNMAVAASGQGGLLVRVDPAESVELVERTPATEMEMRGRRTAGGSGSTRPTSRPRMSCPRGSTAASRSPGHFQPSGSQGT
jgi:hypothetical protein